MEKSKETKIANLKNIATRISELRPPAFSVAAPSTVLNVRTMAMTLKSVCYNEMSHRPRSLAFHFDLAATGDKPGQAVPIVLRWQNVQDGLGFLYNRRSNSAIEHWNDLQLKAAAVLKDVIDARKDLPLELAKDIIADLQQGSVDPGRLEPYFAAPDLAA